MPNTIQHLHSLIGKADFDRFLEREGIVSPKLKVFLDLAQMVKLVPELDYEKEVEEARDKKYGRSD